MSRKNEEHKIQADAVEILRMNPALEWLHAIPNGGKRNVLVAVSLKAEGVKSGIWDLDLPVSICGYGGLKIEVKYGKNKLTESQARYGIHCSEQGYAISVCRSVNEICDACYRYLRGVHTNNDAITECNSILAKSL